MYRFARGLFVVVILLRDEIFPLLVTTFFHLSSDVRILKTGLASKLGHTLSIETSNELEQQHCHTSKSLYPLFGYIVVICLSVLGSKELTVCEKIACDVFTPTFF